jgi:hypothetical protein
LFNAIIDGTVALLYCFLRDKDDIGFKRILLDDLIGDTFNFLDPAVVPNLLAAVPLSVEAISCTGQKPAKPDTNRDLQVLS